MTTTLTSSAVQNPNVQLSEILQGSLVLKVFAFHLVGSKFQERHQIVAKFRKLFAEIGASERVTLPESRHKRLYISEVSRMCLGLAYDLNLQKGFKSPMMEYNSVELYTDEHPHDVLAKGGGLHKSGVAYLARF